MNIGKSIKRGMLERDMRISHLCQATTMSRQTVSGWINNQKNPSLESVKVLARLFGVPVSKFIEWGE